MNIYELTNHFWKAAEVQPFNPSECAMYFYLLHRANLQHWQMPILCPTTTMCMMLGMTKQNVMKVRLSLTNRGMITMVGGGGRGSPPSYTLLLPSDKRQLTGQPNGQLMGQPQLSDELTPYKDIKNKENNDINTSAREKMKNVEELKGMLSRDIAWQQSVVAALARDDMHSTDDITPHLNRFFLYLEARGIKKREEEDCKAYFFNWLSRQFTCGRIIKTSNNDNGNRQPFTDNQSQRRGFAVSPATKESYAGRF